MRPEEANPNERIEDLLCDRVIEGLDPQEEIELQRLMDMPAERDDWGLDVAAAGLAMAGLNEEPLPPNVRESLERWGDAWAASRRQSTNSI